MKITFEGWDPEDRQPVRGTLQGLDRAQTQAAEQITVHLTHSSDSVVIKQNPTALKGAGIKVGAAVWDGAYVLAAYLDAQPAGSFQGLRCVELGCGCGLLGLVLARLGAAAVYVTDKAQHLVGPRVNAAKNKLLAPAAAVPAKGHVQLLPPASASQEGTAAAGIQHAPPSLQQQQQQQPTCTPQLPQPPAAAAAAAASSSRAVVQVVPLDWEDESATGQSVAAIRSQGQIDLIVASDCIYPDPDGTCPSSSGFMAAVNALATPGHTRVLTTFEARSDDLRHALLAAAAAAPQGCEVARVGPEELPEGFRAQHVELYELRLQHS